MDDNGCGKEAEHYEAFPQAEQESACCSLVSTMEAAAVNSHSIFCGMSLCLISSPAFSPSFSPPLHSHAPCYGYGHLRDSKNVETDGFFSRRNSSIA
mmetsp:Transcript_70000/g.164748  ORF Transcript_70000/g.164748 Transcript_70000/m.164748 type:complete len:97 (+) Transcript_70000:120-410(+)